MVVALSLIAGSATLKRNSYIGPGLTVKNQITVGKNAFIGMGAGATKNVNNNMVVAVVP